MNGIIFSCVIAVMTPQGQQICVKPDGIVEIPKELTIDKASRDFWEELAKVYPLIKQEKCI